MIYLAYGSNMNSEQMLKRCPSALFVKTGYLEGFKLVFDGHSNKYAGMVADIRESSHSQIPYVLWNITSKGDEKDLDRYERYKNGDPENGDYNKKQITVLVEGREEQAIVYFMTQR